MEENKTPEEEMEYEVFTLTDEDGTESDFTLLASTEKDGKTYFAMIPAEMDDDSEYLEYVILKKVVENGEDMLVTVEDEDEAEAIEEYFDNLFAAEIDCDADINDEKPKGKK